ncbi:MAG: hypothetical protein ACYSSP_07125 [Planctomycetota bacterium]|jgi:hypothetical protein
MNKQQILEELSALLEADGVVIRREELGGSGGGICTLKGQAVFFLDTQASSAETATLCADAVLKRIDIEKIFIKPEVREFIEKQMMVE